MDGKENLTIRPNLQSIGGWRIAVSDSNSASEILISSSNYEELRQHFTSSFLAEVRQAFADYQRAEGCSCCRDMYAHEEANKRLGKLLEAQPYDDDSGFNWSLYRSIIES